MHLSSLSNCLTQKDLFLLLFGCFFLFNYGINKIAEIAALKQPYSHKRHKTIFQEIHDDCRSLTHLFPMHPFSIPWKHQKTVVFRGVEKGSIRNEWVEGLRHPVIPSLNLIIIEIFYVCTGDTFTSQSFKNIELHFQIIEKTKCKG